ncbi:rubredoxin [Pinibacter aurantiacus]|uniref:Rubredoxin n=1 Tax=Pinibacter aurantiacus TaxID=2851599 RepID=A0A9E2W346_9BACT|nr:rubredoxin [Pinibacter aurantiacus]MBV4356434.1 rubredoxin [Pinibacter aurantiacus]
MRHAFQFKINFTSGIISPAYLQYLLSAVREAGIAYVRFGLRQQLIIDASHKDYDRMVTALNKRGVTYEVNRDDYPNILSSYAAEEIFIRDTWLKENIYKDIFALFDYKPKLKVNIVDNNQTFTPMFTGNINWIASTQPHYWFLVLRFPKTNVFFHWPQLVYTNDIPRLSKKIENVIFQNNTLYYENIEADGNVLYKTICDEFAVISKPVEESLVLPDFKLPYYEGFNNYGDKLWLGIYRREELFAVDFLQNVCGICIATNINQLYATTWKSIIIKNILPKHRDLWDCLLNKYRINVRHASNELNWQVEDVSEDGLNIKRHVIRHFDKDDVRTFGLCFAVKTHPKSGVFGSIIIKRQMSVIRNQVKALDKFEILYTPNFNPNSKEYIHFRGDVPKEQLGTYLISLCKYFYELQSMKPDSACNLYESQIEEAARDILHQCPTCMTVYDANIGDVNKNIASGTLFEDLPLNYSCSLCNTPARKFIAIERSSFEPKN